MVAAAAAMDSKHKGSSSEVFNTIFGSSTQGLSLFSNNAFRRQKPASPEEGHAELKRAQSSARVSEDQPVSVSLEDLEGDQIRVSEGEADNAGNQSKKKKKKTTAQVSPGPPLEKKGLIQRENLSGSVEAVARKKNKPGRSSEALAMAIEADKDSGEKEKAQYSSHETALKKKSQQQQKSVKAVTVQMVDQEEECGRTHETRQGESAVGSKVPSTERKAKYGKRGSQDVFEPHKPTKRQKISSGDSFKDHIFSQKPPNSQTADPVLSEGGSKKTKAGTKRKKEDNLEARYEKKLRGPDDVVTVSEEPRSTSAINEKEKVKGDATGAQVKKRKRVEGDENAIEAKTTRTYDEDEKLQRTIFVGNLPLMVKRKVLIREFSAYGPVESVRLRSVPLLDTKVPRRGAIIKGQINEAVDSQHAYVVFKENSHANAALAHNMKELCGNHVRVDAAYAPHQSVKGKSSLQYDHRRSIFVGNIPFDVKDEELYQTFGTGKSPEMDIEAVRVVRDPQTSLSKGIAYVLFKTQAGAISYLSTKRKVKLRDRILRISRVLPSQSTQKQPSHFNKHARKLGNMDHNQSERKRAKISASYEGVRATKESGQVGKEKHKAAKSGGQQHINGLLKGKSRGPASMVGAKRKRVEKQQRGISRSKKIRRT
eukprot:c22710_g1_i1 orf=438-2396(-)